MNVDKVNVNLTGVRPKYNKNRHANFTGLSPAEIKGQINKMQNPFMRWMNKFENNIGELQDVCINAVGTGLLAPLFIKYNPLSKTDKDTRTYSAWRQPISAVLAICTSGLVTIPFSRLVKRMSNDGSFGIALNKTPFQDEEFIANKLKKVNPNLTPEQISERVAEEVKSQNEALLQSIKREGTVKYDIRDIMTGKKTTQNMSPESFKDLMLKTVSEIEENEQKQFRRFSEEKIPNRIERSEYFRTNAQKARNFLQNLENGINNESGDIVKYLKQQKNTATDKQLTNMLLETIEQAKVGKDEALVKIRKMLGHIDLYENLPDKESVIARVNSNAAREKAEYERSIKFLTDIKADIENGKGVEAIEEKFRAAINEVSEINGKKVRFRLKNKIFSEEVVKKLKDLTKKRIDGCKRIANLIVALAVLPVACSLLNWIYPRFMAAVFPNLSNKKHGNESKELVEKATKNSEVK